MTPFEVSDALVDDILALSPIVCTELGFAGSDHLWDDFSPDGREALVDVARRHRRDLADHVDHSEPDQQHAARVLVDWLDLRIAEHESGDDLSDVNHVYCVFTRVRDVFDIMARDSADAWAAIAARLASLESPFSGWRETLKLGLERGEAAAVRQVDSVVEQAENLAGNDSMFVGLLAEAGRLGHSSKTLEESVTRARQEAKALAGWLAEDYRPHAVADDGVGKERYLRSAERFLGLTIDPRETYEWAWSEVQRLRTEMVEEAASIDPGASIEEAIHLLDTDPDRTVPPDAFPDFVRGRLAQAVMDLDGTHFDVPPPIRPIDVRLAPPGGALGAWYVNPTVDWERPGSVWYALGDLERVPVWQEVSTAYHEGFPGHHLQIGTSMYQGDRLSRAHRLLVWYSGYGEGWALYAERLMDELGYFEKPDYRLGMLAMQLFRSVRVVVDIGCHLGLAIPGDAPLHPGGEWNFETAVDYVDVIGMQPRDVAESEVKRYLGWPGQAISYKVGEREILDLRHALEVSDPALDIKDFHRRILEGGEVRLDHLRSLMLDAQPGEREARPRSE